MNACLYMGNYQWLVVYWWKRSVRTQFDSGGKLVKGTEYAFKLSNNESQLLPIGNNIKQLVWKKTNNIQLQVAVIE